MLFIAFHVNVLVGYVLFIALHVNVWWGTCCSSLFMLMFGGVRVVHRFAC